jgi:hypothetical protein
MFLVRKGKAEVSSAIMVSLEHFHSLPIYFFRIPMTEYCCTVVYPRFISHQTLMVISLVIIHGFSSWNTFEVF